MISFSSKIVFNIAILLLVICLCFSNTNNTFVLLSQTTNKKVTPPKQQPKPKSKPKPKFPDKYSSLDNPSAIKIITEEMMENKIENARQSYIRGLILIDQRDTVGALPYFESALIELNKLASYPDIEENENYVELFNNVYGDYNAVTKNNADVDLFVTPKYKIFEAEAGTPDQMNIDSLNIINTELTEDSNYTKPPSADTSDKYIFAIPHITELQIPITENQAVEEQVTLLTTKFKTYPLRWMERSSRWFPLMKNIAANEGMPEEILVLSIIESGLNPLAESKAGAVGLWQFMYPTGMDYNLNKMQSIWVDERRDPVKSTRAAMRYLRDLYLQFEDWYLALNAYNWGWGRVRKALRQSNAANPTYWDIRNQKNINMPTEAKKYVPLFLAALRITSEPEKYGIDVNTLNYAPEFKFDVLEIEQATNLSAIAQCIGVGVTEIKELNPELLYDITPPDRKYYRLRIPVGSGRNFATNFDKLPDEIKQPSLEHRIGKNETVVSVAEKFDISIDELIKINSLNAKYITLESNKIIKIPIGGKTFAQSNLALSNNKLVAKSSLFVSDENYYVPQSNESIYEIAQKYNISPAGIRNWNNIPIDQDSVEEGRVIIVSGFEAEKKRLKIENNNTDDAIANAVTNTTNIITKKPINNVTTVTHKVVAGDNLYKIAQKYKTTESAIKNLNPKIKDDKVLVGDLLIVPNNNSKDTTTNRQTNVDSSTNDNKNNVNVAAKNSPDSQKANDNSKNNDKKTHTVVQGDNLYKIASKYSTTVDKLISLNKNIVPDKLSLGQKIRIK